MVNFRKQNQRWPHFGNLLPTNMLLFLLLWIEFPGSIFLMSSPADLWVLWLRRFRRQLQNKWTIYRTTNHLKWLCYLFLWAFWGLWLQKQLPGQILGGHYSLQIGQIWKPSKIFNLFFSKKVGLVILSNQLHRRRGPYKQLLYFSGSERVLRTLFSGSFGILTSFLDKMRKLNDKKMPKCLKIHWKGV